MQFGNKLLDALHINEGKINPFQDMEMGIVGDNEFGVSTDCAIDEFVVIGVGFNQVEEICGFHPDKVGTIDEGLDNGFC